MISWVISALLRMFQKHIDLGSFSLSATSESTFEAISAASDTNASRRSATSVMNRVMKSDIKIIFPSKLI